MTDLQTSGSDGRNDRKIEKDKKIYERVCKNE